VNAKRRRSDRDKPETESRVRKATLGIGARRTVIAGVIVLATAGVAYGVWRQVRSHVLSSEQYLVKSQQILLTPRPPWIRSDVKDEVLREASLNGPLSLLEPQLTARIAAAFSSHPWISSVQRVSKRFPSGLEVNVIYRRPVAMVEVPDGALPVDVEGVVLPTSDFQPGEADLYPRVGGVHTSPAGLTGSPWGDAAVVGGAEIAAAFGGDWDALDLLRVTPARSRPGGHGGIEYTFAVFTRGGTRIDWGLAPQTTVPGEPPAADKIARLKQFAARHGSLDGPRPQQLRFTAAGTLEAIPRAPVAPLPRREGR